MVTKTETAHNPQAVTLDELRALLGSLEDRLTQKFDNLGSRAPQLGHPVAVAPCSLFVQTGKELSQCLVIAEDLKRSLRRIEDGRGADYVVIPAGRRPASADYQPKGPGYSYTHERYV